MAGFTVYRVTRRDAAQESRHIEFAEAMAATHTKSRVYEREVEREDSDAA